MLATQWRTPNIRKARSLNLLNRQKWDSFIVELLMILQCGCETPFGFWAGLQLSPYFTTFQLDKLISFLDDNNVSKTGDKTLVFAETKRTVDFLEMMLSRARIRTSAIHGDKSQV